jgi:hypothetical protein
MQKLLLSIVAAAVFGAPAARAQLSAYVPEPGEFIVTAAYQWQYYNDFWLGNKRFSLKTATGFEEQRQHSAFVTLEYGIARDFAADATIGYSWAEFHQGPGRTSLTDDGITDTTIGLRYRLVNERVILWAPTITVRVGGIIAGSYDDAFPFSSGDGANGFETSLLLSREICPGFGVYGEIGYRWRDNNVPDDFFGTAGVWARYRGFIASVGYRHIEGQSGPDIGDPGFGIDFGFPQVKEIQQNIEASLGYIDGGGRQYQLYFAKTLDGRNTGDKEVFGVLVSLPFGGTQAPEALHDYRK